MIFQLRKGIQIGGKYIDPEIRKRIFRAQENKSFVTDVNFLEVVKSRYQSAKEYEFPIDGDAVFVIVTTAEQVIPALVTVMNYVMIDGTVIQSSEKDQLNVYFDRWKRQAKQSSREIKTL